MKPKHRVYCYDCGKPKLLFETEKKALNFIKFNADEIEQTKGYKPERIYFCKACGGYHVTHSKVERYIPSITDKALERFHDFQERWEKNKFRSKETPNERIVYDKKKKCFVKKTLK